MEEREEVRAEESLSEANPEEARAKVALKEVVGFAGKRTTQTSVLVQGLVRQGRWQTSCQLRDRH